MCERDNEEIMKIERQQQQRVGEEEMSFRMSFEGENWREN